MLERTQPDRVIERATHLLASCDQRWLFFSGSATKQAVRKQQLRTWKLQQQREQEEKRRQEEEERRKREEEIRRIRDLSNQDEQYNRFMKLVGGKMRIRSRVRPRRPRPRETRADAGRTHVSLSPPVDRTRTPQVNGEAVHGRLGKPLPVRQL